jgi:hypothetical protein
VVSDWSVKTMTFDKVLPQFIKGQENKTQIVVGVASALLSLYIY